MAANQTLIKLARLLHLYSGVFFAPALLFFAFTGGVQTFSLHETTRGSSYKPPAILAELGQLHKKQTLVLPARKAPPGEAKPEGAQAGEAGRAASSNPAPKQDRKADRTSEGPAAAAPAPGAPPTPNAAPPPKVHNLLAMKIFFLTVALGLFFSTLTGLYMAYKYARRQSAITLMLLAGVIVPLLLLLF